MKEIFGEAWERLFGPPIAHRGLWSADGPPENSLGAFHAACAAGYGIELDVQLSADGEAMVFHDAQLRRMTDREGRIADHTADDLRQMRLAGGDERSRPSPKHSLKWAGGRWFTSKSRSLYGEVGPLERRVCEILIDHAGPTCVIGFNPYSHAWFADHHPRVLRGLDSYSYRGPDARHLAPDVRRRYATLGHVSIAKPHFLALSLDMLPSAKADTYRRGGMPVIAWTVRDPDEWEAVRDHCDNLIFEGFAA